MSNKAQRTLAQVTSTQGMASHSGGFRGRPAFFPAPLKFPGSMQGIQMCMDSSPYLPGTVGSPALVTLTSQADDSGHSGLQMHGLRPFPSSQEPDKEPVSPYHTPFTSPAAFPLHAMFGQTDTYPTLPTHLLPVSSTIMTPPGFNRQVSFLNSGTGGAFRHLGVTDERRINGFHRSAFLPTKCLKVDNSDFVTSQPFQFPRYQGSLNSSFLTPPNSSSTPSLTAELSSPVHVKEECATDLSQTSPEPRLAETPTSVNQEQGTPDEVHHHQRLNQKIDGQTTCCPVCGVTIISDELLSHFEQEVEKLKNPSKALRKSTNKEDSQNRETPSLGCSRNIDFPGDSNSRWNTFQRVQRNRHGRLGVRTCKGNKKTKEKTFCLECNDQPEGVPVTQSVRSTSISDHIMITNGTEDKTENVEGYEHSHDYKCAGKDDDEQDLNVDDDDTATYGQPQYTEADIIFCSSNKPLDINDGQDLKSVMLIEDHPNIIERIKWISQNEHEQNQEPSPTTGEQETGKATVTQLQTISFFKLKVKKLEKQIKDEDKMKCLICMEFYTKPMVSVCCWHVHCEECWLRTLGTKKLCPQCNMITSPTDLRRIYL
ncbi:E3 ubiquitin-protein ligase Rnf220-like [Tachypleus tridentatus]|uniref:E3 ubiquitin-protein ligase Rnf220-like n=1 Tax=Tachypleus tridentatus TaxID=6853 RepID=UPI003FD13C8C